MGLEQVYVVFSKSNTGMGKMIRGVTGGSYNHVSISLTEDLRPCYSFARRNKHNPLCGGFVIEDAGRLCDTGDIQIRVCCVPISRREYKIARGMLEVCKAQPQQTIYNTYEAIMSVAGVHLQLPGAFTCVEFVGRCLGMRVIRIESLLRRLAPCTVYEGSYLDYTKAKVQRKGSYFKPLGLAGTAYQNAAHFGDLNVRMLCKLYGRR